MTRNADITIEIGDLVRVFRETDKMNVGPFPVIRVDKTQIFVIENDRGVQFSIHQVIPATHYDNIVNGDQLAHTRYTGLTL